MGIVAIRDTYAIFVIVLEKVERDIKIRDLHFPSYKFNRDYIMI